MRKTTLSIVLAVLAINLATTSCGTENKTTKKDSTRLKTAMSISEKWCELNHNIDQAKDTTTRNAAKRELRKFSDDFDKKYANDEWMAEKVTELTDKCTIPGDYDGD